MSDATNATDPDGAFVEELCAKLGPLFDPGDIEYLAGMARRAAERDRLRAALRLVASLVDRDEATIVRRMREAARAALGEDTP